MTSRPRDDSWQTLRRLTVPGDLARQRQDGRLECVACAHRCALRTDDSGRCGVRHHDGHALRVPFGYVAAYRIRPIETNTVFHVLPGASALTFGMYGCDLHCPYCHNWRISQALRTGETPLRPLVTSAEALVSEAVRRGCRAVCAAYNEPMIAAEWVRAVFTAARQSGLVTVVVSDGNTTREALEYLRPVTDVYRIDVKGFSESHYRGLGGRLATVLEAVIVARALGYWVEAVTLVVPGFNDELAGLRQLAATLAEIDPGIPWHLNAFVPRYRWRDRPAQGAGLLVSAAGSGYARGLRHVYVGNVAHGAAQLAHTRCPECHRVLIRRQDYQTTEIAMVGGRCPACGTAVAGLFAASAAATA